MARHSRRRNEQLARQLKAGPTATWEGEETSSADCAECGRIGEHAEWCMAEDGD